MPTRSLVTACRLAPPPPPLPAAATPEPRSSCPTHAGSLLPGHVHQVTEFHAVEEARQRLLKARCGPHHAPTAPVEACSAWLCRVCRPLPSACNICTEQLCRSTSCSGHVLAAEILTKALPAPAPPHASPLQAGFVQLSERQGWEGVAAGGRYFFTRNASTLVGALVCTACCVRCLLLAPACCSCCMPLGTSQRLDPGEAAMQNSHRSNRCRQGMVLECMQVVLAVGCRRDRLCLACPVQVAFAVGCR